MSLGGPEWQHYSYSVPSPHRLLKIPALARIFNILRSPRIDSKELIPPGCVAWLAWARICRSFKETRYRFSARRAGTKPYLSYWPATLHRLAKSIPQNRFRGSINIYKYGLRACICRPLEEPTYRFPAWRASTTSLFFVPARRATQAGGIDFSESNPGLHKRLQIRALYDNPLPTRFLVPIVCSPPRKGEVPKNDI